MRTSLSWLGVFLEFRSFNIFLLAFVFLVCFCNFCQCFWIVPVQPGIWGLILRVSSHCFLNLLYYLTPSVASQLLSLSNHPSQPTEFQFVSQLSDPCAKSIFHAPEVSSLPFQVFILNKQSNVFPHLNDLQRPSSPHYIKKTIRMAKPRSFCALWFCCEYITISCRPQVNMSTLTCLLHNTHTAN